MAREAKAEGWVGIGAYVPQDVKTALVELAHQNRTKVSAEIRTAINAHIAASADGGEKGATSA